MYQHGHSGDVSVLLRFCSFREAFFLLPITLFQLSSMVDHLPSELRSHCLTRSSQPILYSHRHHDMAHSLVVVQGQPRRRLELVFSVNQISLRFRMVNWYRSFFVNVFQVRHRHRQSNSAYPKRSSSGVPPCFMGVRHTFTSLFYFLSHLRGVSRWLSRYVI